MKDVVIPQYDLDGLGGEFEKTAELEREIASFVGVRHAVMVSSGTVALYLALKAVGSRVVAVSNLTMFGSAAAVDLAGCALRIVSNNELPDDVDTFMHVSLNGRDCGVAEIRERYPHVTLIEDACQSLGSLHAGKYLGTFGRAGCFSFSPHKIISAGNGGCVVTNDDALADAVRVLKNFGRLKGGADVHPSMGYNFKFTDLQAEFALSQYANIRTRIERKKEMYARYAVALAEVMLPHAGTPWYVDMYPDDRDRVIAGLRERGIGTRVMYPLLSAQTPLGHVPVSGDTSEDERRSLHGLWLPSSLSLTDEQIDRVIESVQDLI